MHTSRLRRAMLAAAIGLVPAAIGGGAIAIASTPPPVPTATPVLTPTPVPGGNTTLCIDPSPEGANRPAYLTAYARNAGSSVSLYWGFGTGPVMQGPCFKYPSSWRVFVDDVHVADVIGSASGQYEYEGTKPGETHTFRVESINNANLWSPRSTTLTVTATDTPPTPTPIPPGGTPTPTPVLPPPTPTPPNEPTPKPPTPTVVTPTPGLPTPLPIIPFTAKGKLVLRASGLSGTFAVSGPATISAPPTAQSGIYGTLAEFTSSGTLLAGGFLPIQTTIRTSAGKLAGTKDGTTAALTTPYSVKIVKASILGVTLTSGGTCTSSTSTLPLSSVGAFDRLLGGKLAGDFTPGKYTGCGALGQYLSVQPTKSSLSLTLTP